MEDNHCCQNKKGSLLNVLNLLYYLMSLPCAGGVGLRVTMFVTVLSVVTPMNEKTNEFIWGSNKYSPSEVYGGACRQISLHMQKLTPTNESYAQVTSFLFYFTSNGIYSSHQPCALSCY